MRLQKTCRFDKCVELGMVYIQVKKEEENEESVDKPSPSNVDKSSLLELMRIAYEKSCEKRIAEEFEIVKNHSLKRFEHPAGEFYISTLHSFIDIFPTIIREIVNIFEEICPLIKQLIVEDKAALFQDFIGKFTILEGFYRTFVVHTNHFFASLITCYDCDNPDQWIREEDWVERKADFRGFVRNYLEEYDKILLPLYSIEQFTKREFMALLIIEFCDIDPTLDLPEEIFEQLEGIRKRVFAELQDYYKNELQLQDVSSRMGTLMTIAHSTSEAGLLMNEEFRTYSALFDVFSGDFLLKEIFFE